MKRKQVTAILLSAIMTVSACVPMNGIGALAAENAEAQNTETAFTEEKSEEPELTEAEEADAESVSGSQADVTEEQEADIPEAAEEEEDLPDAAEEREDPSNAAEQEENVSDAEVQEAADLADTEEQEEADAGETEASSTGETAAAEPVPEESGEAPSEGMAQEDAYAEIIEEAAGEETNKAALNDPTSDAFANAAEISVGDTVEADVSSESPYAIWKFTPAETVYCSFYSEADENDTYGEIYDSDHRMITSNDDDGGNGNFRIEYVFKAGTTYYLAAKLYYGGNSGTFPVYLTKEESDFVVGGNYSQNLSVSPGEEITLSVSAYSSTGELTYEWGSYSSDETLGTDDSLTVTPDQKETYYCEVSNGSESATRYFYISLDNQLKAYPEGAESENDSTAYINVGYGSPVTLKVNVSALDTSQISYSWDRYVVEDGDSWGEYETIEGENTAEYQIAAVTGKDEYRCTVKDQYDGYKTVYFNLGIETNLEVERVGEEYRTVNPGEEVTLQVKATADEGVALHYKWYCYDEEWTPEGTDTAEVTFVPKKSGYRYTCTVSDDYDNEESISYYVYLDNKFKAYPEGAESEDDDTAYLNAGVNNSLTLKANVSAVDTSQIKYQWYHSEGSWSYTKIEGADTAEYTVSSVTGKDEYRCNVEDQYGNYEYLYFNVSVQTHLEVDSVGEDDKYVSPGEEVTLQVQASADEGVGIHYKWNTYDIDGWNPEGADTAEVKFVPQKSGYEYYCEVSDDYGNSETVYYNVYIDNQLKVYPEGADSEDDTYAYIYVSPKSSVTLRAIVSATDTSAITYEWYNNNGKIENAKTAEYAIASVGTRENYYCNVEDQYGNSKRVSFYVSVQTHLKVSRVGNSEKTVLPGEEVTLQVEATADEGVELHYKWSTYGDDGWKPEGLDTASVSFVPERSGNEYYCSVSDDYGNVSSVYYYVYIDNQLKAYPEGAVSASSNTVDLYVPVGSPVTLRTIVSATDTSQLKYKWRRSYKVKDDDGDSYWTSSSIDGADTAEYSIEALTKSEKYTCTVNDQYGNSKSVYFNVNVQTHLNVTGVGEFDITVSPGEEVTLQVQATADEGVELHYKWDSYASEWKPEGTDTASVTFVPEVSGYDYSCTVSDDYDNEKTISYTVYVDSHLKVYPEGAEDENENAHILVRPKQALTLKTIATADEGAVLSYRWYRQARNYYDSDIRLKEGAENTLDISSVEHSDTYYCRVSDNYGNYEYAYFEVEVDNQLKAYPEGNSEDENEKEIALQPGETATLKTVATAEDDSSLTYQWYKGTEKINGETSPELSEAVAKRGNFQCTVEDQYGNGASAYFYVSVSNNMEVRQEGNAQIYNGYRRIFTAPGKDVALRADISAKDKRGIDFVWYKNGSEIEGAKEPTYVASGNETADYWCHVTDAYGYEGRVDFSVVVNNHFFAYAEGGEEWNEYHIPEKPAAGYELKVIANADDTSGITYEWAIGNEDSSYSDNLGYRDEKSNCYTVTENDLTFEGNRLRFYCFVSDAYKNTRRIMFEFTGRATFTAYPEGAREYSDGSHSNYVDLEIPYGETQATIKTIVEGEDTGKLSFVWKKDGSVLEGEDSDSIIVSGGDYNCTVSNEFGYSETVYFDVHNGVFTAYPEGAPENESRISISLQPGETKTLKVIADAGEKKLSYRWYDTEYDSINGETADSMTLKEPITGTYRCRVNDEDGRSKYVYFDIKVGQLDARVSADKDAKYVDMTAVPGEEVTLKPYVTAGSDAVIKYRWYASGTSFEAKTDSVTFTAEETGGYYCEITDQYGNSVTLTYRISVNAFTANAESRYVTYNPELSDGCELRVIVEGEDTSTVKFRWYDYDRAGFEDVDDWGMIISGNTDHIVVNPAEDSSYACSVYDDYGNRVYIRFYVYVHNDVTALPADMKLGAYDEENNCLTIGAKEEDAITLSVEASSEGESALAYLWRSHDLSEVTDPDAELEDGWVSENSNSSELAITAGKDTRYVCTVYNKYGDTEEVLFDVYTSNIKIISKTVIELEDTYFAYDGKEKKPAVTVSFQNVKLTEGVDYTVAYSRNIDAGEATVTVTGAGEFSGSGEKTFVIHKAAQELRPEQAQMTIENSTTGTISITGNANKLSYRSSNETVATVDASGTVTAVALGTADIIVTADGSDNYEEASIRINVTVVPLIIDINKATITVSDAVYDGTAKKPVVNIVYDGNVLFEGSDYTVTCDDNINAGTYTATINGIGGFKGSVEKSYAIDKAEQKITAEDLSMKPYEKAKAKVFGAKGTLTYTSSNTSAASVDNDGTVSAVAQGTAEITVSAAETDNYKAGSTKFTVSVDIYDLASEECSAALKETEFVYDGSAKQPEIASVKFGDVTLTKDTDFTVSYENNINTGTGSVILSGNNKVTSNSKTLTFTIGKAEQKISAEGLELKVGSSAKAVVEGAQGALTFTSADPAVATVAADGTVTAVAEGTTKITVNAAETENYKAAAAIEIAVSVVPATIDVSELEIAVDAAKLVYDGKEKTPKVTVKYEGKVVTEGFKVTYENNVNAGLNTAKAVVTGDDLTFAGTKEAAFTILPGKTTRGDMFNLANNVKVTWKEVPGAVYYKVYREGVTDPNESRKDPVIVTDRPIGWDKEPGLTNGHAYRYKIVASLTGKGDSSGDSTLSYSKLMYRLKTVVIRSVKNTAPGKVTVKYDRTATGDSYVLQYCERQDMVGAKTKVVLGAKNTSYVIGGLKKGKTYYISIRVRKKVNGIDYYTTFGVAKKIKITK